MDPFKTTDWLEDCLDSPTARPNEKRESTQRGKDEQKENTRTASKPHSTPLTLKWLEETYEIVEGVCIPRSTLYLHYLDYCEKNDTQPVNAASFGKIIRQQFPQITTRRLGTRGQSKYHYYGIGVKETSPYYDVMYSRKGVQSSPDGKKDSAKQMVTYSPRSKLGTLLPEFPNVKDLKLPPNVTEDKVNTFLMMYRTHCQRILDTVIRANFDEVQSFLLHFWQGMPQHIVPILGTPCVVKLVGVCDSVLYKAISGVLMPTVLQPLPDSLTQVIRKFAKQLDEWLKQALYKLPDALRKMKFDLARRFAQLLRRQTSLNHLCQASRTVIHSADITSQMLEDWVNVDLSSITKQTLYTMDKYCENDYETIVSLYKEFEQLIEERLPIEAYLDWLDNMVNRCVIQPSSKKTGSLRRIARQFLLMWSCFGTRVIRDMTLHSAPSFGSFHLLHLMFDDYVLFLVENLHSSERSAELMRSIKGEEADEMQDDLILPNPSVLSTYPVPGDAPSDGNQGIMSERETVITDTREAYLSSNSTYASSPQSVISGHTASPAPSTNSAQYDNMADHHVTPVSPTNMAPNSAGIADNTSDHGNYYGRYMGSVTSYNINSDVNNSYNYGGFSNSQYYYGGTGGTVGSRDSRDPGAPPGGTCGSWGSERYSSNLTPLHSTHFGSQHTGYPQYSQNRGSEYDSSYAYDNSTMFAQNTRSHTQNGVIYQHYSADNAGYYSNGNNDDVMSRKRKQLDDDGRSNSLGKRMNSDYGYLDIIPPGGYARA